jgi:5-oxoprolinase (ATP-hydrolysing)
MAEITQGFEAAYRQRFAFLMTGKALMVEAVSVEAVIKGDAPVELPQALNDVRDVPKRATVRMFTAGSDGESRWWDAGLFVREDLRLGDVIAGPPSLLKRTPPPLWSLAGKRK